MLIIAVILMSIGFAAISTTLIINGNANVSENNEDFIELTIKIPIGANKGTEPYDGYAMAEDYEIHQREMAEKKEKAKKLKEEKIKRDKLYRENKKRQKEGRAV